MPELKRFFSFALFPKLDLPYMKDFKASVDEHQYNNISMLLGELYMVIGDINIYA